MRWLYHVLFAEEADAALASERYAPASLAREGFVHASYRDAAAESARLYFPSERPLRVLRIDPRLVGAPVEEAVTPRGPMPHVHGAIPRAAIVEALRVDDLPRAPDAIDRV